MKGCNYTFAQVTELEEKLLQACEHLAEADRRLVREAVSVIAYQSVVISDVRRAVEAGL